MTSKPVSNPVKLLCQGVQTSCVKTWDYFGLQWSSRLAWLEEGAPRMLTGLSVLTPDVCVKPAHPLPGHFFF